MQSLLTERNVSHVLFVNLVLAIAALLAVEQKKSPRPWPEFLQMQEGALELSGMPFPRARFVDVLSGDTTSVSSFTGPCLVVLFSSSDCRRCLLNTFRMVQEARSMVDPDLPVLAVQTGDNTGKAAAYRRLAAAKFPFVRDPNGAILDLLNIRYLPAILAIGRRKRVWGAHFVDSWFSEYNRLSIVSLVRTVRQLRNM